MIKPVLQDDAFLGDVAATRADRSNSFRLWWLGQSGFLLQWRSRHLLFDPYLSDSLTTKYATTKTPHVRMSQRVVAPAELNFVDVITSTHNHTDHLDRDTLVPLFRRSYVTHHEPYLVLPEANEDFASDRLQRGIPLLLPVDSGKCVETAGFRFHAVPAAHAQFKLDAQGRHEYLGFVVEFGDFRVYHSGDTVVYEGMAEVLRQHKIDVALLPINGKVGNMGGTDAARLAKAISAGIAIPCHFDMFRFNTANPQDEFVPECERLGQPYRVLRQGERFSSSELRTVP